MPAVVLLLALTAPAPWPAWAPTLTVTDCGDSGGPNQLRQVIATAGAGDIVNITCGTVTLTMAANPLTINKNLTPVGAFADGRVNPTAGIIIATAGFSATP